MSNFEDPRNLTKSRTVSQIKFENQVEEIINQLDANLIEENERGDTVIKVKELGGVKLGDFTGETIFIEFRDKHGVKRRFSAYDVNNAISIIKNWI